MVDEKPMRRLGNECHMPKVVTLMPLKLLIYVFEQKIIFHLVCIAPWPLDLLRCMDHR